MKEKLHEREVKSSWTYGMGKILVQEGVILK
jgi:hypothetical protein